MEVSHRPAFLLPAAAEFPHVTFGLPAEALAVLG